MARASGSSVTVKFYGDTKDLDGALKRSQKSLGAFGVAAGIGIAAAARGIARFGTDSVKAYAEAEKSQMALQDAFARFPKLSDRSYKSLAKYNQALARKTRFDDDAIASAQALLARFKLTGKQLEDITPLVLDYAAATGKTADEAAKLLGKAMLGNTRALKDLGINYKVTGDTAKDYAAIQALVAEKVGGFAEKEGKTAAGQLEILRNQFGELKETIGEQLMPVFVGITKFINDRLLPALLVIYEKVRDKLRPVVEKLGRAFRDEVQPRLKEFGDWMSQHNDDVADLAKAFGAAAAAVLAVVAAVKTVNAIIGIVTLFANPWLIALAAIGLVAGAITYLSVTGPQGVEKIRAAFETAFTWLRDEGWLRFKEALGVLIAKARAWWDDPNGGGKFREGMAAATETAMQWLEANTPKFGARIGRFLANAMLAAGMWVAKNPQSIVKGVGMVIATMGLAFASFNFMVVGFFKGLAVGGFTGFKDKIVELLKGFAGWLRDQFTLHVNWSQMLKGAGGDLATGLWDSLKSKLRSLFGGGGGGWSWNLPGKASGGRVSGGRPYVVGERGPELFLPNGGGTIVPNHRLGAAGGVTVIINGPVTDRVSAARWINDALTAGRRAGLAI